MKKTTTLLLLNFLFNIVAGQIPAGYYNGTTGLTGAALKTKLSSIITAGHTDRGYDGLYNGYPSTDSDNYYENDGSVLDMYSENPTGADPYNYQHGVKKCGSYVVEGDCYNREHVVPQSLFNSASPMVSDIHFIRPTDGKVNGYRSNYPYSNVASPSWTSKNGSKLGASSYPGYSGSSFEPINEFKGDIARMIFYFVTRYESKLSGFSTGNILGGSAYPGLQVWELKLLLSWHQQDPVSATEIKRNNASYTFQGNRNPYIDHPEYVDAVWSSYMATDETKINTAAKLSVYPNPVKNGELFIKGKDLAKAKTIHIFSADGKLTQIIGESSKAGNKIILNKLPKGIYILKVDDEATKFIVE